MPLRTPIAFLGAVLSLVACTSPSTARPCEGGWSTSFGSGDIDGEVNSMLVDGSTLYVAGALKAVGGQRASGFARWDGQQWHAMDPESVYRASGMFKYDGELYGIGEFVTNYAEYPEFQTARWMGDHWQHVPELDGILSLSSTAEFDGALYIADENDYGPLTHLMRWDGQHATLVASFPGPIHELEVFDGHLYAAVFDLFDFDHVYPTGVVRWNGSDWETTGFPEPEATDLEVHDGRLYATGSSYSAPALYVLDDGVWQRVPGRAQNGGYFKHLHSTPDGLIVSGGFLDIDGQPVTGIARWHNGQWSALGSGLERLVNDTAVYNGAIVACGALHRSGMRRLNNIARFDGSHWSPLAPTGNGPYVSAYGSRLRLTAYRGQVVCTSFLGGFGSEVVSPCATWNGHAWHALGDAEPVYPNDVFASQGELYGQITHRTTWDSITTTYEFFHWTGASWEHAFPGLIMWAPRQLTIGDTLYFAGYMVIDGVSCEFASYRNGVLTILDPETTASWNGVSGLIEFLGRPVVFGDFTSLGNVDARHVGVWQDDHWETFGDGVPSYVSCAVSYQGNLYVASGHSLLAWDGAQWQSYANLPGNIYTLVVYDGALYIGIATPHNWDTTSTPTLWRLTPEQLVPILDGPTDTVEDMTVVDHGDGPVLTLAGEFAFVGDISSPTIAQYTTCPCAADANYDDVVNAADLAVLLSKFNGRVDNSYEGPDFNGDQVVNFADLSVLLSRFGQPCP